MSGATEHCPIHSDLADVLSGIRQTERREGEGWSSFREHGIPFPPLVCIDGIASSTDFTGERVPLSWSWSGSIVSDLYSDTGT